MYWKISISKMPTSFAVTSVRTLTYARATHTDKDAHTSLRPKKNYGLNKKTLDS